MVAADDRELGGAGDRLLVLGAGPAQIGLLAAARQRGIYVIAVDRDPSAPGFRYADRRAIVSTEDEPGIERLAGAERVDGVIAPGIDWPVAIAARVSERLGLPHPITIDTAILSTSKLRQRDRFADAGVPQPEYVTCSGAAEAAAAGSRLGYPCVVKAPDRQGQRGLTLVSGPEGMEEAVGIALDASRSAMLLVEEHVPGREVTVNAFSTGGRFQPLTVTDRLTAAPPAFGVALTHAWPSDLDAPVIAAVIDAAAAAAAAVGIEDGPSYTQVLVGDDGSRESASSRPGSAAGTTRSCAARCSASTSTGSRSPSRSAGQSGRRSSRRRSGRAAGVSASSSRRPASSGASAASRRRSRWTGCGESGSTASPVTASGRSCAGPTGPVRCWRSAPPGPTPWHGLSAAPR